MTSDRREIAAFVLLLQSGHRPWSQYADLVEDSGSALAILYQEVGLFAAEQLEFAKDLVERWEAQGFHVCTVLDRDYPENLRTVHDRPPLLFIEGRLERSDARSIAVVGARQASKPGTETAAQVARHLVESEFTVVSGLAAGIDSAAHTAALSAGGRTVAVIGTGLARSYPPQNAELQRRIAKDCAVISQFWPDSPPTRRSFPMRNAVMSGLTLGTVVVEASHTSGSRIQARLALDHGRPVFLLETLLAQPWAKELADRPGVHVVRTPSEITTAVARLTSSGALTV